MKKFVLPLLLIASMLAVGAAEAKKSQPHQSSDRQINWSKELDLSKEQKAQVKEIYNQSHEKVKSLMQQIDTLHREIANIRKEDEAKIRSLLTEKQQIKFDKAQARLNKGNPEFERDENGKKPSRKRMRQYGGF